MKALRFALYPVVFLGCVSTLVTLLARGVPYAIAGPAVLVFSAIVVTLLERAMPHAHAWTHDQGDLRTDLAHLTANLVVSQTSVALFTAAHTHLGALLALWPAQWPFIAQFIVATLIVDLGLYLVHRLSHGNGALWRLHAIHHSPRRVYWLNGQRRHVAHEMLEGTPGLLVLFVLGAPPVIYAAAIATVTLHLMWQHANIEYRAGPLKHIFAVAELHRWHHQRRWQDVQGNYAAIFSFWDTLFGTALPQRGPAPDDVGMDDTPDMPPDFVGQSMWPFRSS